MQTLYEILGVPESATPADIKRAFRKLSMRHHPDKNPGNPSAGTHFREILDAYKVLSDEDARFLYDQNLHQGIPLSDIWEQRFDSDLDNSEVVAEYEKHRKEQKGNYWLSGMLVIVAIIFGRMLFSWFEQGPHVEYRKMKYGDRAKVAALEEVGESTLHMRNGEEIRYLDWEVKTLATRGNLRKVWAVIMSDTADFLHVSVSREHDRNGTEDWLFRKNHQNGFDEIFHYSGGVTVDPYFLRLEFGDDVDTFRSCRICRVENLPHPNASGIYLEYKSGAFRLAGNKDKDREDWIHENLAYLSGRDPKMLTPHSDNGLRKEYLRQFLTWHFLNPDFQSTLQLFNSHYRYPDSKDMWRAITDYIDRYGQMLSADMDFEKKEGL